jgi:hypothetical protein
MPRSIVMSLATSARHASATVLAAITLGGCFIPVSVVPASEAPPIPEGEGWSCFESVAKPTTTVAETSKHTVRCQRAVDQCNAQSDKERRSGNVEATSTCSARPMAYCTAMFMSADDPSWGCFGTMEDCQALVGGIGGMPGVKQSECAAYN